MPTLTEVKHPGEHILREVDPVICREPITVVSGQNLAAGTVLGKVTASGKYAAYAGGAADGTETAVGVLYAAVDASAGDQPGVMSARLTAFTEDALTGLGADGKADLAPAHIVFR